MRFFISVEGMIDEMMFWMWWRCCGNPKNVSRTRCMNDRRKKTAVFSFLLPGRAILSEKYRTIRAQNFSKVSFRGSNTGAPNDSKGAVKDRKKCP